MKRSAKSGFTLVELLVVIAIIGVLSSVVISSVSAARVKARDSQRISELRQIQYALSLYYGDNGNYPNCLYAEGSCTTVLNGSIYMRAVPRDPSGGAGYTYAANGSGTNCNSYHLGASLEDKKNKALLLGNDAPAAPVCTGSLAGFSGLSYAAGGAKCNATAGIAQPSSVATAESCYDLKP